MEERILVPKFVSIAGSFVDHPDSANDLDIVVRARYDRDTGDFSVPAESLMLVIRNAIRELFNDKNLPLHFLYNPTGPHSDFIPVADLALRFYNTFGIEKVKAVRGENNGLQLIFLGTGPAIPIRPEEGEERSNTSTAIAFGDVILLVDAPDGIAERLSDVNGELVGVLITHCHRDAVSGLRELANRQVNVFGPSRCGDLVATELDPLRPVAIGPFRVVPVPVTHADTPTFGYHISVDGYPTILVVHDIGELSESVLTNLGDVVVFDGAGWGKKIGDGHLNVLEAIPVLKAHGASVIYLTQVGRACPKDAEKELPDGVFIAHDRMVVNLTPEKTSAATRQHEKLAGVILATMTGNDDDGEEKTSQHQAPDQAPDLIWPTKPAVPFYVEHFSPEQMWKEWGDGRTPFYVEPKWNGWRIMIDGIRRQALTESLKDVTHAIPPELFIDGAVLDGELLFERAGSVVPRHELPAALGSLPESWKPVPKIFDVLAFNRRSLANTPYEERRKILEAIVPQDFISPATVVSSLSDLRDAFEQFGFLPGSEGIVAKTAGSYLVKGGTNEWSKVKRMIEVAAEVVGVERTENGYVYRCRWKDGPETGKTMVTKYRARPGDSITVIAQELVPAGNSLRFQNAVVTGVNERDPMTIEQAKLVLSRFISGRKVFYGGPMPFKGVGSKARLADIITSLTPDHRLYVEPFLGSGGYFMRRPKVAGITEIVSDIDIRKVLAFRIVRDRPSAVFKLLDRALRTTLSTEDLHRIRHRKPRTATEALFNALVSRLHTSRGFDGEYSRPPRGSKVPAVKPGTYLVASLRLRGVTILEYDAFDVIQKYDSPNTFFYLDPPYPIKHSRYKFSWGLDEFIRLIESLKSVSGKFILSCPVTSIQDVKKAGVAIPKSWKIVRVKVRLLGSEGPSSGQELLVLNYAPRKGEWIESVKDRVIPLPHIGEFNGDDWKQKHSRWADRVDSLMRQFKKALTESLEDFDEPTRSEAAMNEWERRWSHHYPKTGTGKFVIQRHIRGIPEDEMGDPPEALAERHSVHLDIRFTGGDGRHLFGFTIFVPEDSKSPLDELNDRKPLQCAPKLAQPVGWLRVGTDGPTWSKPGDVGATSQKYARFDAVDFGEFAAGTWNRHSVEVVLRGRTLTGRFIFQQIRPGTWVVRRVDGKPIAQRYTKEQLADRLSKRGHELFIYRDPSTTAKPEFVAISGRKDTSHPVLLPTVWSAYLALLQRLTNSGPTIRIVSDNLAIIPITNAFADLTGDVVPVDEIKKIASRKPKVPLLLAHSDKTVLGEVIDYRRVGRHLFGVARLNDLGARVCRFIKKHPRHPSIAPLGWGTSIGFRAVRTPTTPRELRELRLLEVSILPVGQIANPWTGIMVVEGDSD